jgi:hypothetical protein
MKRGRQLRRPYTFSEIQVLLPSKGNGHDWTNDDGIGKRFPRRVEHAFDVTIQRSHHTYSGEHRWPVMFCNEEERFASRTVVLRRVSALGSSVM